LFRLEAFGGLTLTDEAGLPVAIQRRRLALLALLATAGPRGLSRDRIVGFLWPESPTASARHSLDQLIHLLRRQLDESVVAGTDPLHVNA
jgi:DNA-binding SARP family transcriptional activator